MNYDQIKAYLTVCETGSLSRAANELFVSKTAIFKIISSIEKEFKVTCFNRNKSGCQLTQDGEIIYKCFVQIIDIYDSTKFKLRSKKDTNTITMSYDSLKGDLLVKKTVSYLKDKDIRCELVECPYYNFFKFISQNKTDLAFVAKPTDDIPKNICYKELFVANYYAVYLKENQYFDLDNIQIKDLNNIPIYLSPLRNNLDYTNFVNLLGKKNLHSKGIDEFLSKKLSGVYITLGLTTKLPNEFTLVKINDLVSSWGVAYNINNINKIEEVLSLITDCFATKTNDN